MMLSVAQQFQFTQIAMKIDTENFLEFQGIILRLKVE